MSKIPRLDLELTARCDHRCGHCYNVWGPAPEEERPAELPTPRYLRVLKKLIIESGAGSITITGGEPLLRSDALQIIEHVRALAPTVKLVTNGSHVSAEVARRLAAAGVRTVQLTLLASTAAEHDRLAGARCFDDTLRAAGHLEDAGVGLHVCFVATRSNRGELAGVMELAHLLRARAISYNRMSAAGSGVAAMDGLLPRVSDVEADLETAERLGRSLGLRVSTAMPIPPCLIRIDRFEWVRFGFCSTGTSSPNIVVDPAGNIRSCNLSSRLLGNIEQESWRSIHSRVLRYQRRFADSLPAICRPCGYSASCRGSCKESALAAYGSHDEPDPFVKQALSSDST